MSEERPEMVEIALRIPPGTVRALLSAAAEALLGAEGREAAGENRGFQEDVFRRLSRREERPEGPETAPRRAERRKAAADRREAGGEWNGPEDGAAEPPEDGAAADRRERGGREDRPESSTAEQVLPRRRDRREARSGRREGTAEPSLPEAAAEFFREAPETPARRGTGAAGRRLSAPEPASYAVERPIPLPAAGRPAEAGAEEDGGGAALSPRALSDRWERDSRRYDGGFTLY